MPRTLNPITYALRREAFVETAQRLITSKGYEDLSIRDVLDELGASKGAFYHYFDSKEALLAAVVDRITETAVAIAQPIVDRRDLTAPEKLTAVFATIGQWKGERKDLMLALLRVWMSDANTVVREQLRRSATTRMAPLFATIVCQGQAEGTFHVTSADHAAQVLVALILGLNETATRLFLARQAGLISYEECYSTFQAFEEAFDRILGVPDGTFTFVDEKVAHDWFD